MVFDRYPNGGGEMLLALALADHAHDDGTHIFPSIARLAEKTRQSERSVQYQLRRMEQSGWLVLVNAGIGGRRSGFGEGGRTRQYRINPEWMKGAEIAPFAKGAKQASEGCKTTQERVQNGVGKGATAIAPEPRATKSNQKQPRATLTPRVWARGRSAGADHRAGRPRTGRVRQHADRRRPRAAGQVRPPPRRNPPSAVGPGLAAGPPAAAGPDRRRPRPERIPEADDGRRPGAARDPCRPAIRRSNPCKPSTRFCRPYRTA